MFSFMLRKMRAAVETAVLGGVKDALEKLDGDGADGTFVEVRVKLAAVGPAPEQPALPAAGDTPEPEPAGRKRKG